MKILMLTTMYPSPQNPAYGAFIHSQVEMLRQAGLEIKVLVPGGGKSRKWLYPKSLVQLHQVLTHDPTIDIVHAHYSYSGMVARMQWRVPVVVSFMGCDLLGGVDDAGHRSLEDEMLACAARQLALMVDGVIVKSAEMASKIRRPDVHVIPNEVDFDRFHPIDKAEARQQLGLEHDKPYILFAANPNEGRKRYPFSKDVVTALQPDYPTLELLAVWKETQERLVLYMNACDALIFPSYQEGSPNIVKQAMACNLPIVATDVGDIREVIGTTDGCYVCEPEIAPFATCLSEILQRNRRTQGRDAIGYLHRSVISSKIIHVYEEVLRRKARTQPDAVTPTR
jgi:glycosyltransferase involved in cell wall biosynthesis